MRIRVPQALFETGGAVRSAAPSALGTEAQGLRLFSHSEPGRGRFGPSASLGSSLLLWLGSGPRSQRWPE
eukprot:6572991-Alexandrium_andersonii.AAC.1